MKEKNVRKEQEKFFYRIDTGAATMPAQEKGSQWICQDVAVASSHGGIAAFDGVSGQNDPSHIAARATATIFEQHMNSLTRMPSVEEAKELITHIFLDSQYILQLIANKESIDHYNDKILKRYIDTYSKKTSPGFSRLSEIATTASMLILAQSEEGLTAVFGNAGDSRIGAFQRNGKISWLTRDDNVIYLNHKKNPEEADFIMDKVDRWNGEKSRDIEKYFSDQRITNAIRKEGCIIRINSLLIRENVIGFGAFTDGIIGPFTTPALEEIFCSGMEQNKLDVNIADILCNDYLSHASTWATSRKNPRRKDDDKGVSLLFFRKDFVQINQNTTPGWR